MASPHLTCLLIAFLQVFSAEAACPTGTLTAENTVKHAESPNYPAMYGPRESCAFGIRAQSGQRVYIESQEFNLYKNSACGDNLKIYDGTSATGDPQTFCGMDVVMVQSTGEDVFITFTSDGNREGKGFVLKYWSAPAFTPACQGITTIEGDLPVFIKYPVPDVQNCKYTLRSPDDFVVSLDLIGWNSPESVECGTGSLKVSDDGLDIINHCGPGRPLWHFTSKKKDVIVDFETTLTGDSKPFYLRARRINPTVSSCPNTMVGPNPTFMWFPLFKNGSVYCDSTLFSPETTVRVEIVRSLCTGSVPPSLGFQIQEDGENKAMSCMDGKAVYSSESKDLMLKPIGTNHDNPVLLKVASFEKHCGMGNTPNMLTTPTNHTATVIVLEDIQRDSYCAHKIMASSADEHVGLIVSSTLEDDEDCIMVEGAMNRSGELEPKYCGRFDPVSFTSTGRELTFIVQTNDKKTEGKLHLKYFSTHKSSMCNRTEELLATRTKMTLKTPNYPNGYPLNAMCSWRFVSYRSDYVVVVEVDESDLPDNCNDMGFVNDGELESNDRLGEWCGKRKPKYRGTGQTLLVTFNADYMNSAHKGFKFTYYADNKVPREMVAGTDVMTIAAVFTIIIVAGGLIFIAWRFFTRAQAKRKAKEADRQPITQ